MSFTVSPIPPTTGRPSTPCENDGTKDDKVEEVLVERGDKVSEHSLRSRPKCFQTSLWPSGFADEILKEITSVFNISS
jgi:hypothetical protein